VPPDTGEGIAPGATASANAARPPAWSVRTSWPSIDGGSGALPRASSTLSTPSAMRARGTGAALITKGTRGTNSASRAVAGVIASPSTRSTPRAPSKPMRAANGDGRGSASAANAPASPESRAATATGRSRRNAPSSGTQMVLQASQVASAAIVNVSPGRRLAGGVTVTGSSTSPA
jgi:hypothetical protein